MGTSKSVMLCHGHHVVSGGAHMCVTSTANADDGVYYLALQFRARRLLVLRRAHYIKRAVCTGLLLWLRCVMHGLLLTHQGPDGARAHTGYA
ncbi:hypothetical protein LSM04_001737 [Trypanosoma melophagium]|uniref:uncharacterized protein n=1 Tax=Trypanosoma melophagium TaxID=715481 RepID=UPI00351A9EED|nr:hypothetical protein LSM04_001737 [Trypanosoma melophagium]